MKTTLHFSDSLLIVLSYMFFLPSLYLILTEKRKDPVIAPHAAKSFLLWIAIFLIVVVARKLTFMILSAVSIPYLYKLSEILFYGLWFYCLYCAFAFVINKEVNIPLISKISDRIA